MFENVDGRTDRRTDAGVTGILLAHPGAFGLGVLKIRIVYASTRGTVNTSNSFLAMISIKILAINVWNLHNTCQNSKQGSLIRVCAVYAGN